MTKNYTLPVMISLAVHAALFFGFKTHILQKVVTLSPPLLEPWIRIVPPEDDPIEVPASDQKTDPSEIAADMQRHVDRSVTVHPVLVTAALPTPRSIVVPGTFVDTSVTEIFSKAPSSPIGFGALDNIPRARTRIPPLYPFQARRAQIEGRVVVIFYFDESGGVYNVHVHGSSKGTFVTAQIK